MSGYQQNRDAVLHADVIWRSPAGDQTLFSADSTVAPGSDAGVVGDLHVAHALAAVASASGDLVILRVHMVSGTSDYLEIGEALTIP